MKTSTHKCTVMIPLAGENRLMFTLTFAPTKHKIYLKACTFIDIIAHAPPPVPAPPHSLMHIMCARTHAHTHTPTHTLVHISMCAHTHSFLSSMSPQHFHLFHPRPKLLVNKFFFFSPSNHSSTFVFLFSKNFHRNIIEDKFNETSIMR